MKRAQGETFTRGKRSYHRPYGWNRVALNIKGKYGSSTAWLGGIAGGHRTESVSDEWPVSYHGTMKGAAEEIVRAGYDLNKGKRFAYGKGVYSTPDPAIAEKYAKVFQFEG